MKSGRLPCRQAPLGTPTHKVSSREWTPRVGEKRGPRPLSFHICSEPRDRLRPALPLRNQPWRRLGAGSESSHKHPGRGASGAPPAMGCVRGGGPGWGLCRLPGALGRHRTPTREGRWGARRTPRATRCGWVRPQEPGAGLGHVGFLCVHSAGGDTHGPRCVYTGGVRGGQGQAVGETPSCSMWQGPGASLAGPRWPCWARHGGLKGLFLWKAGFGGR